MTASLPAPSAHLQGVMSRYGGPGEVVVPVKRKAGRPLKRTPQYFADVLITHREVLAWFRDQFEEIPASDRQLYSLYFQHVFTTRGARASRAAEPALQRTLKTALNELSEARRLERANPVNPPISGTTSAVKS